MPPPIDLAPHNPYGLTLKTAAIGLAAPGLRPLQRMAALDGLGALVTGPISTAGRAAGSIAETPAGVLVQEGRWSAGEALRTVGQWRSGDLPVLPRLAEDDPAVLAGLLVDFEEQLGPAAFVIDLGAHTPALVAALLAAARSSTSLPLLVGLHAGTAAPAQALAAQAAGAEALLLLAGPGGSAYVGQTLLSGSLDGPAAEPALLQLLAALRGSSELTSLPLAALAARPAGASALLATGASAILLRAGLWHDPALAARIAALTRF